MANNLQVLPQAVSAAKDAEMASLDAQMQEELAAAGDNEQIQETNIIESRLREYIFSFMHMPFYVSKDIEITKTLFLRCKSVCDRSLLLLFIPHIKVSVKFSLQSSLFACFNHILIGDSVCNLKLRRLHFA